MKTNFPGGIKTSAIETTEGLQSDSIVTGDVTADTLAVDSITAEDSITVDGAPVLAYTATAVPANLGAAVAAAAVIGAAVTDVTAAALLDTQNLRTSLNLAIVRINEQTTLINALKASMLAAGIYHA